MNRATSVSQAVAQRKAVRAFLDTPVSTQTITNLLEKASRSPSGGNVQPWKIAIVNGEAMVRFRALMEERLAGTPIEGGEKPEYNVYPGRLKEPYRDYRFAIGEAMYALLGISREDKAARLQWFANNFRFFGAPAAIFCFVDRSMGPPQWSDLGMFLQTFMLLAQEEGLDSCPQECWSMYPRTVAQFCSAPEELMLFCGMAIGQRDPDHPVNALQSERAPLEDWLTVVPD